MEEPRLPSFIISQNSTTTSQNGMTNLVDNYDLTGQNIDTDRPNGFWLPEQSCPHKCMYKDGLR